MKPNHVLAYQFGYIHVHEADLQAGMMRWNRGASGRAWDETARGTWESYEKAGGRNSDARKRPPMTRICTQDGRPSYNQLLTATDLERVSGADVDRRGSVVLF